MIRNPMYAGAWLYLVGFGLFYQSLGGALYATAFLLATHALVALYEEPTPRPTFDETTRSIAGESIDGGRSTAVRGTGGEIPAVGLTPAHRRCAHHDGDEAFRYALEVAHVLTGTAGFPVGISTFDVSLSTSNL